MHNFKFFLPAFLLFLTACTSGKLSIHSSKKKDKVSIVVCRYGWCQSHIIRKEKSDSSFGHEKMVLDQFELIKQTDTIPAKIGSEFGMEFIVKCPQQKTVTLTIRWTFPSPIVNKKTGETFVHSLHPRTYTNGEKSFSVYLLEEDNEVVKGNWKMDFLYNDEIICTKTFFLE
jgi:hypothetical protein